MKNSQSNKKIKLAVFDIDGTVFRSSLIIELFNELVRRGVFPVQSAAEVDHNYQAWLNRKGHYNDYLMKLVRVFYRNIGGCSVQKIEQAAKLVITRQKDRVYRYPRQLIKQFRESGHMLLVISNSPEMLVRRFADTLKFDAAVGHRLEVIDGAYTGRSIISGELHPGIAFMDKVKVLEHFAADNGLKIDRQHSVMIGDSEGDLPLMEYVGHPIAFNPSLPLAKTARRNGWPIVVERKDVVYAVDDVRFLAVDGQKPKVKYGNRK